jgi:hypothetical protein
VNAILAVGGAVTVMLLVMWYQGNKIEDLKELAASYKLASGIHEENYNSCQAANETNAQTIAVLEASIDEFMAVQEAERVRAQAEAVAMAERHERELEESRRNRELVTQALSAEACASVAYPSDVRRVLNDAIAKASGHGSGNG